VTRAPPTGDNSPLASRRDRHVVMTTTSSIYAFLASSRAARLAVINYAARSLRHAATELITYLGNTGDALFLCDAILRTTRDNQKTVSYLRLVELTFLTVNNHNILHGNLHSKLNLVASRP